MAFRNIVFDESYTQGVEGGPVYSTSIAIANGGYEAVNQNWARPLLMWDVSHIIESSAKLNYLLAFIRATGGKANSFLAKDWSDYQVRRTADYTWLTFNEGTFEQLTATTYQLQKKYYDGLTTELRDIVALKAGTFKLYNNTTLLTAGVNYTVDNDTGILTSITGAFTHWVGEFYFVARLDVDAPKIQMDGPVFGELNRVTLFEKREKD